jgi:hypothetical protein
MFASQGGRCVRSQQLLASALWMLLQIVARGLHMRWKFPRGRCVRSQQLLASALWMLLQIVARGLHMRWKFPRSESDTRLFWGWLVVGMVVVGGTMSLPDKSVAAHWRLLFLFSSQLKIFWISKVET